MGQYCHEVRVVIRVGRPAEHDVGRRLQRLRRGFVEAAPREPGGGDAASGGGGGSGVQFDGPPAPRHEPGRVGPFGERDGASSDQRGDEPRHAGAGAEFDDGAAAKAVPRSPHVRSKRVRGRPLVRRRVRRRRRRVCKRKIWAMGNISYASG